MDVFISYSHSDAATARRFADAFEAHGLSVWWDEALRSGEAFDEAIERALRDAKAVVVLWSKTSVASRWVRAEATLAERNRTLMPCMIEPCERPIMFELTHTAELSHWQGEAEDPAWQAFAREIRNVVGGVGSLTRSDAAPSEVAPVPSQRQGERRQIAVLSCAPTASFEEEVDPEDWEDILAGFRAAAAEVIFPLGGRLADQQGDGISAFFGMDQSREDDAERAVRAGLALRDHQRGRRGGGAQAMTVRVGVDVGVVVLSGGAPIGAPVGAATQLRAQAPLDSVVITPATAKLVGGYFDIEALGARAFRVVSARAGRTRFDISRARGLSSFVGRGGDLESLKAALAQAANGDGQVIGIVAEAGAGKSRLCFEFTEHCRAQGLQVFEGRAVSHGRNIPFLPILDVFRSFFGIRGDDDARTSQSKIDARLTGLDEKLVAAAPLVFEFLGVADPTRPAPKLDPEARQRQLLGLMRHLVKLAGDEQPTVMLIEDLHWMDAASGAFLEHMAEARAGSRSLLVLNFRPEYHAEWMKNSWYRRIALAPLGPGAVSELLADLLGTDPSLAALNGPIEARTRGNPFFVEEIARTLLETGHLVGERGACRLVTPIDRLEVPATVKAVLAARIDRLEDRDRRLLQTASVIGKDFAEPILAAVSDLSAGDFRDALSALRRGEFIQEEALFPVAEYTFRHPLTQEVALSGLVKDRRRVIHAAVANAIEAQDGEHLEERSALLALHWEEAGEALTAARWHARAAEWAGLTNAGQALFHWQRARRLLKDAPQTAETAPLALAACMGALGLSWRLGMPRAEITEVFEEGLKLAEATGDDTAQAALNGVYGCFLGLVEGQSDDYCHYAREAVRLAGQSDNQGLQIAQRAFLGFGCVLAGRLSEGLASCEWAFAHLPADPDLGRAYSGYSPYLGLLNAYAWMLVRSGRLAEARAGIAKAEALARDLGDFEILAWLGLPNAEIAAACADAVSARAHAGIAVAAGERSATPQSRMSGLAAHAAACRLEARWDEAVAASGEAVQAALSGVNLQFEGWVRAELALALLGRGDIDEAEQQAQLAMDAARAHSSRSDEVRGHIALIRVQLRRGGEQAQSRAQLSLDRVQALTAEFELNLYRAELDECRAHLARARGDTEEARLALAQARRGYDDLGATIQVARLDREFGQGARPSPS